MMTSGWGVSITQSGLNRLAKETSYGGREREREREKERGKTLPQLLQLALQLSSPAPHRGQTVETCC